MRTANRAVPALASILSLALAGCTAGDDGPAAAAALRLFTGNDKLGYSVTIPAATSGFEPMVPAEDVTFTWATLAQAAADEGISRPYADGSEPSGTSSSSASSSAFW